MVCVVDNMKFIISRYKEDVSWIKKYTDDYIIYNKGTSLPKEYNVFELDNIGNNQYDIFHFIVENYDNLPELMIFLQANPFDHCNEDKFKRIIKNKTFTPVESYEHLREIDSEGGFIEVNNGWYINAHNGTYNLTCKYNSFDEFMNKYFENYEHVSWIRFTPGSQYIVEKKQVLNYPKEFWKSLMNELPYNNCTEGHIIERSLFYILTGKYTCKIK